MKGSREIELSLLKGFNFLRVCDDTIKELINSIMTVGKVIGFPRIEFDKNSGVLCGIESWEKYLNSPNRTLGQLRVMLESVEKHIKKGVKQ